jgi:hypothetical protein
VAKVQTTYLRTERFCTTKVQKFQYQIPIKEKIMEKDNKKFIVSDSYETEIVMF